MSFETWQKYHAETCTYIINAAEASMAKAVAEEKRLAIERNDVLNGIPYIMVEGDGSYMKRSYKNSKYDSPAACIVVIGRYTKKVLQVVVKQKTCSVCDYALSQGTLPRNHECVRNHERDESSTSMESSAMAEIFSSSIEKHNLMYSVLISDGDSSNYSAILDSNPYGIYGLEVENILCTNHLLRNISTRIKALSKSKGRIGTALRKKIENSAPQFIKLIKNCIAKISEEDISWEEKSRELRNNITKLPHHVFGDHTFCENNKYGCDKSRNDASQNCVPALEEMNLFHGVEESLDRVLRNTKSLLHNVTTNMTESFNAHIAVSIGAKRIHFAKKHSYKSRCYLAVLEFNEGETFVPVCKVSDKDVPTIGEHIQKQRFEKNVSRLIRKANKTKENIAEKKIMQKQLRSADEDYGPHATHPDVNEKQYDVLIKEHYKILRDWQLERDDIEIRTQSQSDSSEWRTMRKWLITGSKMGKICRKKPETSCAVIVSEIVYPRKIRSLAIDHGIAMEVVAKQILQDLGYDLRPCGLFIDHETLGIAATPDALEGENGVVEIKSPYTARDLDPEEAIRNKKLSIAQAIRFKNGIAYLKETHAFYYQVQAQLRVTGRKYCLFVIFTFKNLKIIKVERDDIFINNMIFKVAQFYRDCLLPEIVDSRKKRHMKIRDPEYIIEAQIEADNKKKMKEEAKKCAMKEESRIVKKKMKTHKENNENENHNNDYENENYETDYENENHENDYENENYDNDYENANHDNDYENENYDHFIQNSTENFDNYNNQNSSQYYFDEENSLVGNYVQ